MKTSNDTGRRRPRSDYVCERLKGRSWSGSQIWISESNIFHCYNSAGSFELFHTKGEEKAYVMKNSA